MCGTAVSQSVAMNRATEPELRSVPSRNGTFRVFPLGSRNPMFAASIRKHPSRWRKSPRSTGRASGRRSRAFAILRSSQGRPSPICSAIPTPIIRCGGGLIGVDGGISVNLFIGDPAYLRKGLGRAALSGYLKRIAFPFFSTEARAYIAHERLNPAALRFSGSRFSAPARIS